MTPPPPPPAPPPVEPPSEPPGGAPSGPGREPSPGGQDPAGPETSTSPGSDRGGQPRPDRPAPGHEAVPPPPATEPTSPELVRRSGDRVVAGVAAGLGRRWDIDPVLVRVLFAVTTFAAGIGALVYLVLWIALPLVQEPAPVSASPPPRRGTSFWVGVLVVTIGAIIALSSVPAPRILLPVGLVALGVALWQRPGGSGTAPGAVDPAVGPAGTTPAPWTAPPGPAGQPAPAPPVGPPGDPGPSPTSPVATATVAPPATSPGSPADTGVSSGEIRWWVPPPPRPRPSWLGPITIAVALVATGVVALLGAAGLLAPNGTDLVAVALLVLAGGLAVGSVRGRAKWLALPAVALSGLLVVTQSAADLGLTFRPTIGQRTVAPADLDEPLVVDHGLGQVVVDLSDTDLSGGSAVEVDLLAGQVQVVVPDDARVRLDTSVGVGEVVSVTGGDLDDEGFVVVGRDTLANGQSLDVTRVLQPRSAVPAVGTTLDLDVVVGAGQVEVFRGSEVFELGGFGAGDDAFDSWDSGGPDFGLRFDLDGSEPATEGSTGRSEVLLDALARQCPGAVLDDEVLETCLERLVRSGSGVDRRDVDAWEQALRDRCRPDEVLADLDERLEPCLELLVERDADLEPVSPRGGN